MSDPRLVTDAEAVEWGEVRHLHPDPNERTPRLLATRKACEESLGRIEEMVGEGFADVVVANTMLGRIKREATTLLSQLYGETP